MRILGIDPGFAITGYGIIEQIGNKLKFIDCGVIKTDSSLDFQLRLKINSEELQKIITGYKPEIMAIEELFFTKNTKTAIKVAESRGVLLLTGIQNNLPIYEYTPLQIKQALTGYGRADKNQIQQMVKILLCLNKIPKPDDAADALAIAITCAQSYKSLLNK